MKRTFGNFVERLLWGGTRLTDLELELLQHLVVALPPTLRTTVEKQLAAYNLVQREIDGRALNFYRKKAGSANNMDGLPVLEMVVDEAPLVRLTARVSGESEPLHVTLNAVNGRVFCMALSRRVSREGSVTVLDVTQSWRSNFQHENVS